MRRVLAARVRCSFSVAGIVVKRMSAGTRGASEVPPLPSPSPTSAVDGILASPNIPWYRRRLVPEAVFLLENGIELFLWVGREASPALLSSLFGISSIEGVDLSSLQLQVRFNRVRPYFRFPSDRFRQTDFEIGTFVVHIDGKGSFSLYPYVVESVYQREKLTFRQLLIFTSFLLLPPPSV